MNAAEITDKLGLHSLRQRAWVCFRNLEISHHMLIYVVHSIHLCYFRRWSVRRFGVACAVSPKGWSPVDLASPLPTVDCLRKPNEQSKRLYTPPYQSKRWCPITNHSRLFSSTSIGGVRWSLYDESKLLRVFPGFCVITSSLGEIGQVWLTVLFSLRACFSASSTFLTPGLAILCFGMV